MLENQNILEKFQVDLKEFYILIQTQSEQINKIYKIFDDTLDEDVDKYFKILTQLCNRIGLKADKPTLMAMCDRIANLKEGPIIQVLKNHQKSNSEILVAKRLLLNFVSHFYAQKHQDLLSEIRRKKLLSEFYREILLGIHHIGLAMNNFFESWQDSLIDGINKNMQRLYGDEKSLEFLAPSIDKEEVGGRLICSDRSYSIPKKLGDRYISIPYVVAFDIEIKAIIKTIEKLLSKLENLEDNIYNKKQAYMDYFVALKNAFGESHKDKLIEKWREVDICWMDIDTPLQIGHPLEYYEDRYRHSVAPEWDIRIANPDKMTDKRVQNSIQKMFLDLSKKLDANEEFISFISQALQKVKTYNGLPTLYYGADMNGLFSAQVVPNDEVVSKKFGKKIFAFGDKIIQSARSKPKMKLNYETFQKDYLQEARDILFENEQLWHLVYDITTNGHEFGHILWIEEDTQRLMNADGDFKNIEEFKATCSGLVAFFQKTYDPIEFQAVMSETIRRSVGLMAWREQEEVLPYYCEGLIHLYGAFISGVLEFNPDKKPVLEVYKDKYDNLKEWYIQTYESLVKHYINKFPSGEWLKNFVIKNEKCYQSKLNLSNVFIEWYWKKYQEVGQEIL
ncbi:invasion protein CiaB [Helicobacter sp. 11S03491-1]|uniref:invasion protein CiaB n=1 Tax=Helicobacter sp. 11S03491-1 TaxID=1476196 RepID=UPI000BA4F3AC|nr:invasion protein CiaB [Helicobacter sp. 11S03491-1]PAF42276.1 hypothetical protein BKH45_04855 [Helicobacter sp. 11S03491-1]